MNKTKDYHIIEVDCKANLCKGGNHHCDESCEDPGAVWGCHDCNGTGKRRRAVWQLKEYLDLPGEELRLDIMDIQIKYDKKDDFKSIEYTRRTTQRSRATYKSGLQAFIGYHSPYQSSTDLPTGETLEEVELKQLNKIHGGEPREIEDPAWHDLCHKIENPDTWLCTALIQQ